MYRYVKPEQSPPILTIANLLGEEYPKPFKPISQVRPHVSILAKGTVLNHIRDGDTTNSTRFARQVRRQARSELLPGAGKIASARCVRVDYIGRGANIGIFLESDQLSEEIDYSYQLLETAIGREAHGDRRPHISIGKLLFEPNPALANRILNSMAELCADHLPSERLLYLGAMSLDTPFIGRRDFQAVL